MTEEISPQYKDLDIWTTGAAVEAMFNGQLDAIKVIMPALQDISKTADAAAQRLGEKGRLFYVGAGTSGRLAVLDGSELGPTFGWPFERLVFCMAGGAEALLRSQEGAEDIAENGQSYIQDAHAGPEDVVICVAASGRTPFTLGALREAQSRGAMTVGISNNADTPLLIDSDFPILAETGGEILAGSTRMKAGTAQKAILNMLSTAIMIRLGRVYNGLMVDMIVSNTKLENRAAKMVSQIAKCSIDDARSALRDTNNDIKKAVLICRNVELSECQSILQQNGGNLRQALAQIERTLS